jgi:hypothetical protein
MISTKQESSVKTTTLKWWLIPLSCLLTSQSQSQTTDLEYVKAIDPALYQKLLKIEQCRKKADHRAM